MLRISLIRIIWRGITFFLPISKTEKAIIPGPKKFLTFSGLPSSLKFLSDLTKTYQKVFADSPWRENWKEKDVINKLKREADNPPFFLVLMQGDEKSPIEGFSWGGIVSAKGLENKILPVLGVKPKGLEKELQNRGIDKILYFYEIAILPQFRGGLNPLRFLIRPGFELGYRNNVNQALFWSTPMSKIVPLSLYFGYEIIFRCRDAKDHEIIFLFNPDCIPFLKVLQNIDEVSLKRKIAKITRLTKLG